jgi:hypothetical protein
MRACHIVSHFYNCICYEECRLLGWAVATCSRWFLACGFFCPEDGGDTFLRNVGSHKIYTAPHPRRQHSSQSLLWKPQILHVYGMSVTCTQFVYVVKYYSSDDLYMIKLDLFYIWRLYRQILISGWHHRIWNKSSTHTNA